MLLKNNEPWKLTDKELEEIAKIKDPRDKSAFIFRLSNRFRKKRKTVEKGQRRTHDTPKSFSIPPFYDYQDEKGNTIQLRYYETSKNQRLGNSSELVYSPSELLFDSSTQIVVDANKKELIWFLMNHPRQATSEYRNNKAAIFYLEDKQRDAKVEAKKKSIMAHVNALIWGPGELKLSNSDAKQILMGYGHPNVGILTDDQVRVELDNRATKDEKAGQYFITQTTGNTAKIRAVIQEADDLGVIKFIQKSNAWCYMNNGNVATMLVSVGPREKRIDKLADFLSNTDKNGQLEHIMSLIEQEKFDASGHVEDGTSQEKAKASKEKTSESALP